MSSLKNKFLLGVAGILGLGSAVLVSKEIAPLIIAATTEEIDRDMAEGNICVPHALPYEHVLNSSENSEVFSAGCGGLF